MTSAYDEAKNEYGEANWAKIQVQAARAGSSSSSSRRRRRRRRADENDGSQYELIKSTEYEQKRAEPALPVRAAHRPLTRGTAQ